MKREKRKPITYPRIKEIKPLFWRECLFCNKEFKNESGYKILDYLETSLYIKPDYLQTFYCCNECAKNVEEVKMKFEEYNLPLPRLSKPPIQPII